MRRRSGGVTAPGAERRRSPTQISPASGWRNPATKVISVVIFDLKEEGQFGAIAVLGIVMLLLTFATVTLVQRVLGRDVLGVRE